MVEDTLVGADIDLGRRFMTLLDESDVAPRCVVWLRRSPSRNWRLLVSPAAGVDREVFHRRIGELFASEGSRRFGVDLGSIRFVAIDNPLIEALREFVGTFDDDVAWVKDTMLNGLFVEEAVILRMS